jgi:hypothetical protein
LTRLLEASRAAESEIAALRKSHFEISESLALPAAKDRAGAVDWKARTRSFRQPEVALYEQRTQDPPEAKSLATKFLKLCIEAAFSGNANDKELETLASAVITTGSKDPMIEAYAYLMRPFPKDVVLITEFRKKSEELSQRLAEEDRGLNYEVQMRRLLIELDQLDRDGLEKTNSNEQVEHLRQFTESMVRMIERASEPENHCQAWLHTEYYSKVFSKGQKQAFYRRVVQSEKTADWYKALAAASLLVDEGWEARNSRNAENASEDGWKVFRQKIAQARSMALLAWKIQPETPQPATLMESVVGSGAEDDWGLRQWFQVAVHARFDHEAAYLTYKSFMQPQWGGSDRELLSFARECIASGRLDTRVPEMGLSQLWDLNYRHGMKSSVMRTEDARAAVSQYAEQALHAIEKKELIWTNLDLWNEPILQWLVEAGNYPLAQKWFNGCNVPFYKLGTAQSGGSLDRCQQIIAACTGPASDIAEPLVARIYGGKPLEPGELPELREKITALKSKDTSELTGALCHEMEIVIGQHETFESGAWTPLKFNPEMAGWQRIVSDQWAVIDEQTLTMQSSEASYVYPVARFQPPYMVEVEVQFFDPEGKTPNSAAALMTGFEWMTENWYGNAAIMKLTPNLIDAHATIGGMRGMVSYPAGPSRHLRIKVWPEEVECTVAGSITNQGQSLGQFMTRVALGVPPHEVGPTAYRFHNLRIRKLPYEAVIPIPEKEMDTYGQRVIDFDPTEPEGYVYQHSGHMYNNNIPAAIKTLETAVQKVARKGEMYANLTELYFQSGRYQDAWNASLESPKHSIAAMSHAYRVMLLACSDDPNIRNPQAALENVESARPDWFWQGALAKSLAEAANGEMDAAKASMETAVQMAAERGNGRKEVAKFAEIIRRGEVPILKEGGISPPETSAEAAPATP